MRASITLRMRFIWYKVKTCPTPAPMRARMTSSPRISAAALHCLISYCTFDCNPPVPTLTYAQALDTHGCSEVSPISPHAPFSLYCAHTRAIGHVES
jgi:hypothetical protein